MTDINSSFQLNPDVLAFNENVIRRRFPGLVHEIARFRSQWPKSVAVHETRTGVPTISVSEGQATIHVHSAFDPVVEAERWLREPTSRHWDCAIVFGAGLGYHLDALIKHKPHGRLLVVEPRPDVFCAALAVRAQKWLTHPYLHLIVTDDPFKAAQELASDLLKAPQEDVTVFTWPSSARYAPEYRKTLESKLVDTFRLLRTDIATRQVFHKEWVGNFLRNARAAVGDPGIAALQGKMRERPAIIAAAGPSLEKNVRLLSEAKGKALIIAAGSAIRPLLKNGIEADLVLSFDAGAANYRHFEGLHTPNVPLLYVPIIYPRIVDEYAGPRFTAAMDLYPFVGWLFAQLGEEKGILASGPSVANVAWHFAYSLGMNPIILVGQDLAFTGGKTHAAGTAHAREVDVNSPDDAGAYITTEGSDGRPVVTSRPMYSMKVWFEERLRAAAPGHMTIDATEGGAKIAGAILMTLREALSRYCTETFGPHEILMEVHRREAARLDKAELSNQLDGVLHSLAEDLKQVARMSADGLKDARQLLREAKTRKLTEQRFQEALTRLSRKSKQLERLTSYQVVVQPTILHVVRAVELSRQTSWEKESDLAARGTALAQKHVALFTAVTSTAREVQRFIGKTLAPELPDVRSSGTSAGASARSACRITHVAFFTRGNAGDTLLTAALRDLFDQLLERSMWQPLHAHRVVGDEELGIINGGDLCVIGGGGLFLKDTNPNDLSGWQWSCSLNALSRIRTPIVVFAVGYNRFRGQEDFGPAFYEFIPRLVEKALFFGLRNHGSIRSIQQYLPDELHEHVRFQPCMTTLLRFMYPNLFIAPARRKPFVAVNCAFDRSHWRYGDRQEQILNEIARALKALSAHTEIRYYAHNPSDEQILPLLQKWRVPYKLTRLYGVGPDVILNAYRTPTLVIGMRGHAQMIPFGCGVPILSLISHDKLAWFLEDIDAPEWGVDIGEDALGDRIVDKAAWMLNAYADVKKAILNKQNLLWEVTKRNFDFIRDSLSSGE